MATQIIKDCKGCKLHETAKTVCMAPIIHGNPKLIIFLDNPTNEEDCRHKMGASKAVEFVQWLLARMSITDDFAIVYTLRCFADEKDRKTQAAYLPLLTACSKHRFAILQKYPEAVIVGAGKLSCHAMMHTGQHGEYVGCEWEYMKRPCWIAYSPNYALQSPGETPSLYRVLWKAAEQADMKPKFNKELQLFDYERS